MMWCGNKLGLALALVLVALLTPGGFTSSGEAHAQEGFRAREGVNGDGADTHLFRPAVDSKGFFSVNGSRILGAGDVSFGLVLDYGRNLLRVAKERRDPAADTACVDDPNCIGVDALVDDSFQGTFNFNYGIANKAVIGLALPVVLGRGDPAFHIGPDAGALYDSAALDSQGLSWLALHAKLRITRLEETIGLAVVLQGGIPVGQRAQNLVSEPGPWLWPQVVLDYQFGATGRFRVGANAGFRVHSGENSRFADGQLQEGRFRYGNQVTGQLGFAWRALDVIDLVGESYATYLVDDYSRGRQQFSQEYVGGIKLFIERNSYFMMGAGSRIYSKGFEAADVRLLLGFTYEPSIGDRDGDGYADDQDQCPDDPEDFDGFEDGDGCPDPDNDKDGILDVDDNCPDIPEDRDGDQDDDGCPEGSDGDRDGDGILDSRDKCPDVPEDKDGFEDQDGCPEPDNDKDGILDVDDRCPNDPEDKDGFEDQDGCPEPDNDRDGIPDVKDQCPNQPETYNGFEDEDGCPDKGKVVIEGDDILILEKVMFETASSEIRPESFDLLDAVATTLKHHPEFLVIEVAGHADERSSDEYNLKLTQDRARSVVNALVQRHVDTSRLVSQGYGEYCPIDPASTPVAWEKNRRVEFKVVKTEDRLTDVKRGCARALEKGVRPPSVR
jgi:outer membrane protein OmpA-like peptidoglycan-associated protein